MYRYEFATRRHARDFKTTCPQCKGKKKFTLYWDNLNNELAPNEYGKCDRLNSCGYKNYPKNEDLPNNKLPYITIQRKTSYITKEEIKEYTREKHKDPLSIWLIENFKDRAKQILFDYAVFSVFVKEWREYAPLFLLVDDKGNIRSCKIMRYEIVNNEPKRTKHEEYWDNVKWLHTDKEKFGDSFNYDQIAFGSHLLKKYPNKPVNIVESEKSTLILACIRPNFNWLATLSYTGLQKEYLPDLKNSNVTVFPDKGKKTFDYWKNKSEGLLQENLVKSINCSNFIEDNGELMDGDDICDWIIQKLK